MTIEQIKEHWVTCPITGKPTAYKIIYEATVMLVAVVDLQYNTWCAYIKGVPAINHDNEWLEVRRHGTYVPEDFARRFFFTMPDDLTYSEEC